MRNEPNRPRGNGGPGRNSSHDRGPGGNAAPGRSTERNMRNHPLQGSGLPHQEHPINMPPRQAGPGRPEMDRRDPGRPPMEAHRRPPVPPQPAMRRRSGLGTLLAGAAAVLGSAAAAGSSSDSGYDTDLSEEAAETTQETVRAETARAKVPVYCSHCGATELPDENGCCQYCGSALEET